ncbi:MAG: nitronate monooxygenase, partial [Cytophagales bacterium]|nr:nitronate monooxygenase [Cytophagales bacterium]
LMEMKVGFIITSLGSPEEVIAKCKPLGIKVFCDVVDVKYAKKVESLGADAIIAVNSNAGGHAGNIPPEELIPSLLKECHIPIISAGGIAKGRQLKEVMDLGAAGASIGTVFIASDEASVSREYKQALIDYRASDIVRTSKLSGSPLTVINTPYVQSIGTKATFLERLVNTNKWLKKYIKMLIMYRGMKAIEKAAFSATYKTVWCAGPSIEYVHSIRPMKVIINEMVEEFKIAA